MTRNRYPLLLLVVLTCVGTAAVAQVKPDPGAEAGGSIVSVDLEVTVDLDERTIGGTAVYGRLEAGRQQAAFLLMANLDRAPNPALSPVAIDSRYESGFEPASSTIHSVRVESSGGDLPASFHLTSLPAAWQTYSLQDTLLIVTWDADGLDAPAEEVVVIVEFITHVPRVNAVDQTVDNGILTWRFGWFPLPFPQDAPSSASPSAAPVLDLSTDLPIELPALDLRATVQAAADITLMFGADSVVSLDRTSEQAESEVESGTETATYIVGNDHPVRALAMTASRDHDRYRFAHESVPITVYYRTGHEDTARILATVAADIVNDYEAIYGEYPRAGLTIIESPDTSGTSIAADGIVWLSSLFFTHRNVTMTGILDRLTEFVLAHEIAHQWWGIGIGVDLNAENWLSEALAQYLSVSYYERRYGAEGGNLFRPGIEGIIQSLVTSQLGFYNLREHQIELPYLIAHAQGFDETIIKPLTDVNYDNSTAVRLYDKGYLAARAIASAVGRDTFDRALIVAWERYRYDTISVDQLQVIVREASDPEVDVDRLFQTWLREPTSVDYAVRIVDEQPNREQETYTTTVEVIRNGGAVQPVVVDVILASGDHAEQVWDGADTNARLTFVTDSTVRRATIDPGHFLPDVNRLNNHDPVLLVTSAGENAYPLDAYLIRPAITSDGLSISFLDRFDISWSDNTAAAMVRIGRSHTIELQAGLLESDLEASATYRYLGYTPMQLGGAATTWIPTHAVSIGFERRITDSGPTSIARLAAGLLPSPARSYGSRVMLDLVPTANDRGALEDSSMSAAAKLALVAEQVSVIAPHLRLITSTSLGLAIGDLPKSLWFDVDELRSFGEMVDGTWTSSVPRGTQKAFARLAIELPVLSASPYDLMGLAMVDGAVVRVFAAAGSSWTSGDGFGTTPPGIEAGVETLIDLSALGGLLPATLTVGYAAPVVGDGRGVLYVGVSL